VADIGQALLTITRERLTLESSSLEAFNNILVEIKATWT